MKKNAKRTLALFLSVMMVVSMLTLGASAAEDTSISFTDIASSSHAHAIVALAEAGILKGIGDGKYGPDLPVTRAMAVTVLGRMARAEEKVTDKFSDVDNSSWYAGYVGWAADNGIVLGVGDGIFEPERNITGGEMELMLSRYAELAAIDYTVLNTSAEPLTRGELAEMVYFLYTQDSALVVETTNGPVRGYVANTGALAWLGVPYGQAGRWEAPTDPESWTDVRDCLTSGPKAIQYATDYSSFPFQTTLQGSADCLNLDVYAPADAEGPLPVLVFLHGGNNQTGDTTELRGQDLVITNNCVYVALNFRTGPLGFNPLPALKTGDALLDSGNYTLLDIAFALDWVKENIASFGGDPENITISGHSAGGRDVMALLISPLFEGKFDKAFISSGGMTVADEEMSAVQFANYMAPLAVRDGKAADVTAAAEWLLTDSEEVAKYLKSVSDKDMAGVFGNASIHMALFPHLYTDGVVLPKEGFDTTKYNSVPVMMITGINEFTGFHNFGILAGSDLDADTKAAATAFADKYAGDMYRIFNCQESANAMFDNYDDPIYVCQVDYGGPASGHGVFKSFMDPTQGYGVVDVTTPDGKMVKDLYNAYLTNFLHTGDPNGDDTGTKWTAWDPKTQLSMVFDGDGTTGTAEMKNVSKTYADIIKEMEEDTTVSEEVKTKLINTVLNGRWFSDAQDDYFGAPSLWVAEQTDSSLVRATTNGLVRGYIANTGAYAWLGIPYGQADRWEAPTDPEPWTNVRECLTVGPMAIQYASSWGPNGSTTSLQGSADCLNLDVYAPADAEGLPVLVFLHGGNNQTGSTTELRGQELVITNDCVFVTLNFRTGALGFNPLPALKTGESDELDSGNYTLLDIAFALDWVKKNVASFGGDPENITISGHSAGGRDVMALLISPLFEGKFDKAFVSSGGMTTADEEISAIQFADALAPLAVGAGKADTEEEAVEWLLTDGEDVLDFLKSISDEDMAGLFPNASIHMALFPHLYTDGTVLPKEGFATTKYNSVPVMMLTGINEFSMFSSFGFLTSAEYRALDAETQAAAKAFADKYGSDMYRIFNGQESANAMFDNYDDPIYVCQVDYGGSQSGHGVFKSFMDSTQVNPLCIVDVTTPDGQMVNELYNAYLTNFLHSEVGDPNGDGLNKWTSWDPKTQLSMVFDGDGTTGTAEMKNVSKTYADIIKEMEEDTTVSDEIKEQIINTVLNGRWFSDAQDEHFGAPSLWVAEQ